LFIIIEVQVLVAVLHAERDPAFGAAHYPFLVIVIELNVAGDEREDSQERH
jgi:hypothetical protein